jgi:glutamate dehydrogenase/leucine dehydrogenase
MTSSHLSNLILQLGQSADLDKRGLLDSIPLIGPLLQEAVDTVTQATTSFTNDALASLGGGVTQAESIVQNYTEQATAVNEEAKGSLESLLKSVVDKIKALKDNDKQYAQNTTMCLVGQKENAESLVQQAGRTMSAYQGTYCSF